MTPFEDTQVVEPPSRTPAAASPSWLALTETALLLLVLSALAAFVYRLLSVLCCGL
jgi:hypothetical protein